MKKVFWLSLLVIFTIALVLTGCGTKTTPAPAPSAAPPPATSGAPPPATSAPVKAVELRFSTHIPPFAPQVKLFQGWADEIYQKSGGEVKIVIYSGSTLMPPFDIIPGIKNGVADCGEIVTDFVSNERPLAPIMGLPFMGLGDWKSGSKIMAQLQQKFPAINDEYKDFHFLFWEIRSGFNVHTINKEVRLPQDLKGLKMIASGVTGDVTTAMGGSAVGLPTPDWYLSLDRGLVNGMFMDWAAVYEMKCSDFLKFHTDFPRGASLGIGLDVMNQDTWNKLSPNAQKVITDASATMQAKIAQASVDANIADIELVKKAGGHTFIMLTDEEQAKWYEAAAPVHKAQLAKLDAKGLPATQIYEEALRLAKAAQ